MTYHLIKVGFIFGYSFEGGLLEVTILKWELGYESVTLTELFKPGSYPDFNDYLSVLLWDTITLVSLN